MLVPRERLEHKLVDLGYQFRGAERRKLRILERGQHRVQLNADDGYLAPTAAAYHLRRAGLNEAEIDAFIRSAIS